MVKLSIAVRSPSEADVKGQRKLKVISLSRETLISTRISDRMCLLERRKKRESERDGVVCFGTIAPCN